MKNDLGITTEEALKHLTNVLARDPQYYESWLKSLANRIKNTDNPEEGAKLFLDFLIKQYST